MVEPSFADYVRLVYTLFERFLQQQTAPTRRGHPFVYQHKVLIVFFMIMQCLRIFQFKTQHRWLTQHPERRQASQSVAIAPCRPLTARQYIRHPCSGKWHIAARDWEKPRVSAAGRSFP